MLAWSLSSFFDRLGGRVGALTIAGLVFAAVVLIAWAVIEVAMRPRSDLEAVLEPYRLHPRGEAGSSDAEPSSSPVLVGRTIALGERLVERLGVRRWLEERIEQARLPVSAGELAVVAACGVLVGFVVGLFAAGLAGGLVLGGLAVAAVPGVLEALARRMRRRIDRQLPDVLRLLASSLRAGFSLSQGLDATAAQVNEPMRGELRQVVVRVRLGQPLEDALEDAARHMHSRDFSWAVMAIRIQHEVGGNLARLLDTVAATMVQRERLRREIRTLTAEGRISAVVLGLLAPLLGLFIGVVNRSYLLTLVHTTPGKVALVGAAVLEVVGFFWLYRTISIEV
jgi:tight adherence protein B